MIRGTILKRPSKQCKSPYVADVLLDTGEEVVAHAPSLGCCGLCEKGSVVHIVPLEKGKICTYSIWLSEQNKIYVGIYPKNAERIVQTHMNHIVPNFKKVQREKKILNSRFDFVGIDEHDKPFILEVKSVPLCEDKIAYFPDGYRKKKTDVISPRALKHIQELQKMSDTHRCILCFVIQREDAEYFTISDKDMIYKNAIIEAKQHGVEVVAIQIKWDTNKNYHYMNKLVDVTS